MNLKKIKKSLVLCFVLLALALLGAAYLSGHAELALSLFAAIPLCGIVDPMGELKNGLNEIQTGIGRIQKENEEIRNTVNRLDKESGHTAGELSKLRKMNVNRHGSSGAQRPGKLSDGCAAGLGSAFVLHCARSGQLEALSSHSHTRDTLLREAASHLGIEQRTALTTSDIPLPTDYSGEMRELIAFFGVIRNAMFPFPIGAGTSKPPRWGTRPAFGSIALSAPFTAVSPTITFASLESHKLGGVCLLPREIEESSVVAMGQFLGRYGATEFARAEDTWGFLADGSSTYESIKGVCQICSDNSKKVQLGATKTAGSDATLADLRALRAGGLVTTRVLSTGKYYFNATWESRLRNFNTIQTPNIYVQNGPMGQATFDGYPIVWTEVLAPFATTANASAYAAVFGDLSFWWFGEHMQPRIDTSIHPYFVNDQIAVRFIEEIDFDYMDLGAASVLQLAAA